MEQRERRFATRLMAVFIEQLTDSSSPNLTKLEPLFEGNRNVQCAEFHEDLDFACEAVGDVLIENFEQISCSEEKYLLALFVCAKLDECQHDVGIEIDDKRRMGRRLKEETPRLQLSRYSKFRQLVASASLTIQAAICNYIRQWTVVLADELSESDFSGAMEDKEQRQMAAEKAKQFFSHAGLYFTVSSHLQDGNSSAEKAWAPLLAELKWNGPRDALVEAFRILFVKELGVVPFSGRVFLTIAWDVVSRSGPERQDSLDDLMRDIKLFLRKDHLDSKQLLEIAEDLWHRFGQRTVSKERSRDVDQVWVPLLAFFTTYFWESRPNYVAEIVNRLPRKQTATFQDAARIYHNVVDRMQDLFSAKHNADHKRSLKLLSSVVFAASNLSRPTATVSSEVILNLCRALPDSQPFCEYVLLKCFQSSCPQLTFEMRLLSKHKPHNRRICKQYAQLLDETRGWGLVYELNDSLQSIFQLFHRELRADSKPSPNAAVFKLMSYSSKYLQCVPASNIPFGFRVSALPEVDYKVEALLLQEIPEAVRAFRHCSDVVALSPNSLPAEAWKSYCQFTATNLLETGASIPRQISSKFIQNLLRDTTVGYRLANVVKATLYQEFFKALRKGYKGSTVNVPSAPRLLDAMCSIQREEKEDPTVHEPVWMKDFDRVIESVKEEVDELHQRIKHDCFTSDELETLLTKKDEIIQLFQVFRVQIPKWREPRDFMEIRKKLTMIGSLLRILLIHPVQNQEVQDLVHELDKTLIFSDASFETLRRLDEQSERLIGPLQDEMLDNDINARSYLEYFEKERSSVFEGFCQALAPESRYSPNLRENWHAAIVQWLRDVHSAIKRLLDGNMKLSELPRAPKFQEVLNDQSRLVAEMRIFGFHPYYQSAVDRTPILCNSLSTARHISSIPKLVETLRILEVADEGDEDFAFVLEMASQPTETLTLEEIRSEEQYQRLSCLLGDLPGECIEVLKEAGEYETVVKFFRDHDFHSQAGVAEFHHISENMTMRVRGNAFKSDLLNAVMVCRECVTPLRKTRSLIKDVIAAVKLCSCEWRQTLKSLQLVNDNMAEVQRMFSKEMTSAHDDATEQACVLAESGLLELSLEPSLKGLLRCKLKVGVPPGLYNECRENQDVKLDYVLLRGEEIAEFKLLLAFESSRPLTASNRATMMTVLETLDEVQQVVEVAQWLVDVAHPRQRQLEPIVCEFKRDKVASLGGDLNLALGQWNKTLQLSKNECEVLKLFSEVDVAHMMDLLIGLDAGNETEPGTAARRFMSYIYSISSVTTQSEMQTNLQTVCDLAASVSSTPHIDRTNCTEEMRKRLITVTQPLADLKISQKGKPGSLFACPFSGEHVYSVNVLLFVLKVLTSSHKLLSLCQILWCSPLTSTMDLKSFFNIIRSCSGISFVCVGVDQLSLEMRQELESLQHQLDHFTHGDVYFIYVDVGPGLTYPSNMNLYDDMAINSAELCRSWRSLLSDVDIKRPFVTAVCGPTGCGKTRFVLNEMASLYGDWKTVKLTLNEAIDYTDIVQQLNMLPDEAVVFISVSTQIDPSLVNNFMYCLCVCGALYDCITHSLFAFQGKSKWRLFVEVPFEAEWQLSCEDIVSKRFPIIGFVSDHIERMDENSPYYIDEAELKLAHYVDFLSQWSSKIAPRRVGLIKKKKPDAADVLRQMLQTTVTVNDEDTARLILEKLVDDELSSRGIDTTNKTVIRLFFKLLSKRFTVFSDVVLVENTSAIPSLPSLLYIQFVKECAFLCQPHLSCSFQDCSQPLLNFSNDQTGVSFYAIYNGDQIPDELNQVAGEGVKQLRELSESDRSAAHLAWMLNVPSDSVSRILQQRRFVLTKDCCYKMILIHQRKCACVPIIIEGDTGVGKTYLLETYAVLLNWKAYADRDNPASLLLLTHVSNWLRTTVLRKVPVTLNLHELAQDLYREEFDEKGLVKEWLRIAERLTSSSSDQCDQDIYKEAVQSMIENIQHWYDTSPLLKSMPVAVSKLLKTETLLTVEESSLLLQMFLDTPRHSLFHKLLVHPGLQPSHILDFLSDKIELAQRVSKWEVVVFFDEVNTAGCLGLFKEIIVDRTLRGRPLPDNMFIVAAINPYTGLPSNETRDGALPVVHRSDYNVAKLPEVMKNLFWKYGGFNIEYAETYIRAKIRLERDLLAASKSVDVPQDDFAIGLIPPHLQEYFTQTLLTAVRFCYERLGENSVSQRDVQRVFTLLPFMYHHGVSRGATDEATNTGVRFRQALCLTISVAFVWRLPVVSTCWQPVTRSDMFGPGYLDSSIDDTGQHHVDAFVTREHFDIPDGIALTQALKENVFAVVACIQTGVPMGVVGAPGLSKTLSFHIVRNNLKGPTYSPRQFCRQFSAIDPFYYHCSEFSEAAHIELTFHKAIKRQEWYNSAKGINRTRCVVFLDDGGLPSEKKMILKCLHPFLDEPKVSFVAASNRAFDAANANRMITIYRSRLTTKDLYRLAVACLGLEDASLDADSKDVVRAICCGLSEIVLSWISDKWGKFFHYRDFIHVLRCVHRHHYLTDQPRTSHLHINPILLLRSLEENMNGLTADEFDKVVTKFFSTIACRIPHIPLSIPVPVPYRNTVTVLEQLQNQRLSYKETLWTGHLLAPRFTMIIDPTNDLSALQLLFHYGLLRDDSCKVFRISEFPEDCTELQIVKTLTSLCFALEEETTAVFVNCKRLEGSLYDLLNQNYRGSRYSQRNKAAYANIAVGPSVYPCKVNSLFHCVVIVAEKDVMKTPAPFLSRFAKFRLSPGDFLEWRLQTLPRHVNSLVSTWRNYAQAFIEHYGWESLVGLNIAGTVDLILLSGLNWDSLCPSSDHTPRLQVSSYQTRRTIQTHARDDHEWSKAVIVSRLLQLVAPESVIFNFSRTEPSFRRLMTSLYFDSAQHFEFSWVLSQLISDRSRSEDDVSTSDVLSTSKLLLYARSTRDLRNLPHNVSKLFGKQNASLLSIAKESKSRTAIADFLENFVCDSTELVAIVGVDMLSGVDVGLLCQMIDDADHIARNASTSPTSRLIGDRVIERPVLSPRNRIFVLVVHFSGEHIFTSGVISARFLDGWDTFFIEHTSPVGGEVLRGIAMTCAKTAEKIPTDTSLNYEIALKNVFSEQKVWHYLVQDCVHWFCSRIRVVNEPAIRMVHDRLAAEVQKFYLPLNCADSASERSSCLKSVLARYPAIEECVQRKLVMKWNVAAISKLLSDNARQVFSKKTFFALPDLVLGHLKHSAREVFSALLIRISADFGLSTLMQLPDVEHSRALVCDLVALLPDRYWERECRGRRPPFDFTLWAHPVTYKTPLFPLIRRVFQDALDQFLADDGGADQSTLPENECDYIVDRMKQLTPDIGECYLEDVAMLVCTDGVMLEGCELCVKVVVSWLLLGHNDPGVDMISFAEASVRRHCEEMTMLYKAAMSVQSLGEGERLLDSLSSATSRTALVDSLNRNVCEILMETLVGENEETVTVESWLVAFQRYFRSSAAQQLDNRNPGWLSVFYTLTAAYVLAAFTSSTTPNCRVVMMLRQQTDVSPGLRSVIRNLAVVVSSDSIDDSDRSALYIQTLRWLAFTLSVTRGVREDVKEMLRVLNGHGIPPRVKIDEVHYNTLFTTLMQHLHMDRVGWTTLLEEVLQESCSALCRGCHRAMGYCPRGYPERERSPECLRKPLADSYFSSLLNVSAEMVSSHTDSTHDTATIESTAGTANKLTESIEQAAKQRLILLGFSNSLQSVSEHTDILDGKAEHDSLQRLVLSVWEKDTSVPSCECLTGKQLSFLDSVLLSVGAPKAISLFTASSHPYLKSVVGPELTHSVGFCDRSEYMPAVDNDLVIEEPLEMFPDIRHLCQCVERAFHGSMNGSFYERLHDVCDGRLSECREIPRQQRCRQTLKMLILLHCYRTMSSGELNQLLDVQRIENETHFLQWAVAEVRVLTFVVCPSRQMKSAGIPLSSSVFQALGHSRGGCDLDKKIRSICVNHLLLTVGLGQEETYFWSLTFHPSSIVDNYAFGGTAACADSVISERVKLDSCHACEERGQRVRLSEHLDPVAKRILSLITFASILWYVILHGSEDGVEEQCLKILTEDKVNEMAGENVKEKLVSYCWLRVFQTFLDLCSGDGCSPNRITLAIQHVMSRFAAEHRQGNKPPFRHCYGTKERNSRKAAEKFFQRQVFLPVWKLIEEASGRLSQSMGIVQQLEEYRRKQWKSVTYRDFNNALVNAVPQLPDRCPLRTLMQGLSMLAMTKAFVPMSRLYLLIHRTIGRWATSLDEPLQPVIQRYGNHVGGEREKQILNILQEGINAFNSLLEALGGVLHVEQGQWAKRFVVIKEETSLRYVCSLSEPHSPDALFQAMQELVNAHATVMSAFEAYEKHCVDQRVSRLLQLCEFGQEHRTSIVELATFNGDGLISINESEFDALLSSCLQDEGEEGYLSFDFGKVERLVIQQHIIPARRIDLSKSHMKFVLQQAVQQDKQSSSRTPSPRFPPFLTLQPLTKEFQIRFNVCEIRRLLREIAATTRDECVELLENLSLLVTTVCTDLVLGDAGKSVARLEQSSLAQFAGDHHLKLPALQRCPLVAVTRLRYLESVCTLVSEHLECRDLHPQLTHLLKEPLSQSVANAVSTGLYRLSVSSPDVMIQHCDQFRDIVKANFHNLQHRLDSPFVSVLKSVCRTSDRERLDENSILVCIPNHVLVKHVSALLTLVLRAAATTRQEILDGKKTVMWGFRSGRHLSVGSQTWREICLPNMDDGSVSDLVVTEGEGLWKNNECRRTSLFTFDIEVAEVNQDVAPMQTMVTVEERKPRRYDIRDGKRKGEQKIAKRSKLCEELGGEKLANKQGLVLLDSEEPLPDASSKMVTMFKYSPSETCMVCVQVQGHNVKRSTYSKTRVEVTRNGSLFCAEFAEVATVGDVLSVVLSLCVDVDESAPVTAVMHLRDGRVLENQTRLNDLPSSLQQHMYCLTSVKRLFKCSNFSTSAMPDCSLIPSQTRDFFSHVLQRLSEQWGAEGVDFHSFYLWPPIDDETRCDTRRQVCVVPGEWICRVCITADGGSNAEFSCQLPALLTTTMKTAAIHASEKFKVPSDAQVLADASGSHPLPSLVSVGYIIGTTCRQSEPHIHLIQLPVRWHVQIQVVEETSLRDLDVSVRHGSSVEQLLEAIAKCVEPETGNTHELELSDQLQLVDMKSHCILPRLLRFPFCYISGNNFLPRRLMLVRRVRAEERVAFTMKLQCSDEDDAIQSRDRKIRTYRFHVARDQTLAVHSLTVADLLDFLSWLPELSEAFSARDRPFLGIGTSPVWLKDEVDLGDYVRKMISSGTREIPFQLAFRNRYSVQATQVTVMVCHDTKRLCCTLCNMSVTVAEFRQFAVDFLSVDSELFALTTCNSQCRLEDRCTWDEVYAHCQQDASGTLRLTFVPRSKIPEERTSPHGSVNAVTSTSDYTVLVKEPDKSCDIHLTDSSTVEEIIELSLNALALSGQIKSDMCSLYVGDCYVMERDLTLEELKEMAGDESKQIQLVVKLPDSH